MKKKTNEEFIIDAYCKHGDKYNYKFVNYNGVMIKVIIICNTCGYVFEQTPNHHLKGQGCSQCAGNKKSTHKEFEDKARKIHGDKFKYLTKYVNNDTPIIIKCNTCGYVFEQKPRSHLQGHNCLKCAIKKNKEKRTLTHKEFEDKARKIHGDKFKYLTKYIDINNLITIKCNICGDIFKQIPSVHLRGCGCPHCVGRFKKKYALNNIPIYNTYQLQLKPYGIECRRSPKDKNILEVRCMYCGKWYQPTLMSVKHKIQAIKGQTTGEHNLYCSQNCKQACPIYHQQKYPKGFKSKTKISREIQSTLRKLVLKRDNWTCQKCGEKDKQLYCHHLTGIEINPIESADIDNCITFCIDCHDWIHQQKGCTYNDFKRKECET